MPRARVSTYTPRTRFFARRYLDYRIPAMLATMDALVSNPPSLSWPRQPRSLGISAAAWRWVRDQGYNPIAYFAHPDLLLSNPQVAVPYYRMAGLISQKGVSYIEFSPHATEQGRHALTDTEALRLARVFNQHISAVFEIFHPTPQQLKELVLLSGGSQIQGSWMNEIGQNAQQNVHRLFVEDLHALGQLQSLATRQGRVQIVTPGGDLTSTLENIRRYGRADVRTGGYLVFGSEPDIAVYNPAATFAAAIEVKGGTDPAGIQQRIGAAEQAFGRARDARQGGNPTCRTILLIGILTDTTERYIKDRPQIFNECYLLGDVLARSQAAEQLLARLRENLGIF